MLDKNEIKNSILKAIIGQKDPVKLTVEQLGVSRQAVHQRLKDLVTAGVITIHKEGKKLSCSLCDTTILKWKFDLSKPQAEDLIYQNCLLPHLKDLPRNILDIWQYGFTEMVNNVIDHSQGKNLSITFKKTAISTQVSIEDDGEGVFAKIQKAFNLADPREAILELAKGKVTTDPKRHSGEGIFFTSRLFDHFGLLSRDLAFLTPVSGQDWFVENKAKPVLGTLVVLQLYHDHTQTIKEVFDAYASDLEDYAFSKTVVPLRLAQYEGQNLISRSQAKRVSNRFEKFKKVVLDFAEVDLIGQAFADELFRVFVAEHPTIQLSFIGANPAVAQMIQRAQKLGKEHD